MKFIKRTACAALVAGMALSLLAGCSANKDYVVAPQETLTVDGQEVRFPYVMKVGDYRVSLDEYRYYYMHFKDALDGGDESYWDVEENLTAMRQQVEMAIQQNAVIWAVAKEHGVELTTEETTEISGTFAELRTQYQGEDGDDTNFRSMLHQLYLTDEVFQKLTETETLMYDLYDALYAQGGTDAYTPQQLLDAIQGTYVRVKHILVYSDTTDTETGLSGEALAQDLIRRLEEGADFDTLVGQFNQDPGMASSPEGCYFTTGQMMQEFEDAAFALAENEVSGVVQTSYGYHVILRLPMELSYIEEHFDDFNDRSVEFNQIMKEAMDNAQITYHDNYDKITMDAMVNYYPAVDNSADGSSSTDGADSGAGE